MFKEGKDTFYTTFIQLPFNSDSNKFYLNTSRLNTSSWFYKGCCIGIIVIWHWSATNVNVYLISGHNVGIRLITCTWR